MEAYALAAPPSAKLDQDVSVRQLRAAERPHRAVGQLDD
jgi:hypothetical protein